MVEESSGKSRRTQEERSATMRQRLLDATIECLVEYGYSGTTTTRVAEVAGVTRGAQVHHFRTRTELVAAAVRHIAAKRAEVAFQTMAPVLASEDRLDAALDLVWQLHQGPAFFATMELWTAARTDQDLSEQLAQVEPAVIASLFEFAKTLFGEYADDPNFRHCLFTVMDAVRGIMQNSPSLGRDGMEARWQRAKVDLHAMLRARLGEGARATGTLG